MAISVSDEVTKVIARYKDYDVDQVRPKDTLAELEFSKSDARDLAQEINLHFYNQLRMMFDRLLHGRDIRPEHKVSKVIALVKSVNPHPRP